MQLDGESNMENKNGIATLYTGYNYGSALQAFAIKTVCSNLGYSSDIIKLRGLSKNRDIRIKKLVTILIKIIIHPTKYKTLKTYTKKSIPENTKDKFTEFYTKRIAPKTFSYHQLRYLCKKQYYKFFLCGSDQIWNSATLYADPFYYLRFIDKERRISFAPSFGRNYIAKNNLKKIMSYINDIPHLSIREQSGANLIEKYLHRTATVLIDPTLVLSKTEWGEALNVSAQTTGDYVLLYFLNEPTAETKKLIKKFRQTTGHQSFAILNKFTDSSWYDAFIDAGPEEFLSLIMSAKHVFTDSFHGAVFSANFNTPFSVFPREYNGASNQSTRITDFLRLIKAQKRYDPTSIAEIQRPIDFESINETLQRERKDSVQYLKRAISEVKEYA